MRQIRGNEMAMIFQEPLTSLNPVFTVGDQIAEQVKLHMKVKDKEARDRAIEMLRLVGIPSPERRAKQYPHELSGGMRQRVMIGMALSCEPKLLIADEPTTALDVTVQAQILELLKAIQERTGAALMLITHDLGVVAEMVDNVIVMYAGQIVEQGTVDEVLHRAADALHDGPDRVDPDAWRSAAAGCRPSRASSRRRSTCRPRCRFEPRCPYRWETCREVPPELYPAGGERRSCPLPPAPRRGHRAARRRDRPARAEHAPRPPADGGARPARRRMTTTARRRRPSPSPRSTTASAAGRPPAIRNGRALLMAIAGYLLIGLSVLLLGVLIGIKGAVGAPAGRRWSTVPLGAHLIGDRPAARAPARSSSLALVAVGVGAS